MGFKLMPDKYTPITSLISTTVLCLSIWFKSKLVYSFRYYIIPELDVIMHFFAVVYFVGMIHFCSS